ncbi:MAG TPA: hypothetical protein VFR14_08730 [Candidatus Limnocylindrales bacterium]|nr:hypothetical protein [Candidatus Limnocylindrales bacterium]
MRLSEWRAGAPAREAMTAKVLGVVEPVLAAFGASRDTDCWVAWGDEPAVRYPILAPVAAGLVVCHVRVNLPQEGPRASAKLVRWNRVQLGELGIETQGTHRLLSFQVEGHVLRGVDAEADAIAAFALILMAATDGRPPLDARPAPARRRRAAPASPGRARSGATRTA